MVAGGTLWLYVTHQAMPGLAPDAWYPIVEVRAVLLAIGIAGLATGARYTRFRRIFVSALVIAACALVVVFASAAATTQARATELGALRASAERSCAGRDPTAVSAYRGIYIHVAEYQRARGMACSSTRFFLLSRFDFPLELQDAAFSNVVFQIGPKDSDGPLKGSGPRRAQCDAVIVADAEADYYGEPVLAKRLGADGQLELIGRSGKYRAYVVR